ncbi:dipeptidyl aminopeptidase/acylaminoacyl peptidase [Microbacterium trichothecenolyticum]|uniref:S9 family peptidase n=1 Tax=Microbacterium trichothecenolyticum TaxID=69370 RepID=UPI002864F355|nr:S9 family peptidase [Microbacterium trichothecenolyticum]MDR7111775.1 dipeptidyl aminopeptidase/acylaminoacyl peptidase [Microbacterium trichothecenolyticum]
MKANDIETLVSVGRPEIAADGSFAVFATSRPDIAANRNVGQVWRVDLPDGTPRRLTRGTADGAPQLSPDATRIAFVRGDAKGKPQVHVAAAAGGEPVQATDAVLGVEDFAWSPDGASIAFVARVPEKGRYGSVEGLDAAAEAPRHITGVRWHANGLGYIGDRPAHVFVIAAPAVDAEPFYEPASAVRPDDETPPKKTLVAAEARQLTEGTASHGGVVFTADGREILTVPDDIESDRRDLRDRLIALAVDGSGQREVLGTDTGIAIYDAVVAPDGTIALLAHEVGDGVDFIAPGVGLWLLEGRGARRVTDADALNFGEGHVRVDGDGFLVQDAARGRVRLLRVTRDGAVTEVLGGDVEVGGHATGGGRIVAAVSQPDSFGELVLIEAGAARTLTSFGARAAASGIVLPRELTVTGRDGYPVHGWVATPEGEGPFPVILQIHGGPFASYGVHLFDETQVLVGAGYAVVYSNPRGSAGYGRAHGRSIRQQMGTVDFADVIDFLEGAIADDARLDGERVGVQGGSYGGYLTAWVIAHDHRFAGAIVERGFLEPLSFQGTSDIGSFFGDEYVGVSVEDIARQSSMAVVGQVTTPTLVMHSELDFRCPLEQATRYYSALKRQGTEAELLVFPGENHELTRAGQPRHRVQRFDAVLDWWDRHLPVG